MRPNIKLGANLGLIKIRMKKSTMNTVTKILVKVKSWVKNNTRKDVIAGKSKIPAPALASRSLITGISYPETFSPK